MSPTYWHRYTRLHGVTALKIVIDKCESFQLSAISLLALLKCYIFCLNIRAFGLSQRPRGQRRRSTAALKLRLWVQIPPGAWMFVCYGCCVLSGRGLCYGCLSVVSVVCCQVEVCAMDMCLL